jgi:flagellum-specific peptidoglycan hydrolase FlgJ
MPATGRFIPATKTTITKAMFNAALHEAWPGVTRPAAAVLWAQYAIETGRGSACWNNNIGNVKKSSNDGWDYTMLHSVWEILGGKKEVFQPPHPQTWFRSYASLGQGMRAQLDILKKRWPKAWRFVELGDPDAFARALKAGGYYTAPVEQYATALKSLSAEYLKDAGTAVPIVGVGIGLAAVLATLYAVYSAG